MTRLFDRPLRRLRAGPGPALDAVAVLLAAWQAWGSRHGLDPDGVSYLDLGAAWLAGDWAAAWNPYWSPPYAWLLGLAEWIAQPGPEGLAPMVYAVNFGVFLLALAAFRFLLARLTLVEPHWAWLCAAYGIFLEATLGRISLARTTPDLLLAALLLFAAGLAPERRGWALGCVLGLAYLTKAAALPLAPVIVLAASRDRRFVMRAAGGFALAAGWWIVGLSLAEGRLTFGDAGRLNYAWNVLGVERPYFPATAKKIFDHPPAYSFAEPFAVAYPPHYAPSYWYAGFSLWWDGPKQWERLRLSLPKTIWLLLGPHLLLLAMVLFRRKPSLPLLLPALAGLAVYQPVFVAERYVAVFVALFWLSLLGGGARWPRWMQALAVVFLAVVVGRVRPEPAPSPTPGAVAQAMLDVGMNPGDRVAAVWPGPPYLWARPAGVLVVAESRDPAGSFGKLTDPDRGALFDAFAGAGAEWVVALCSDDPPSGWDRLADLALCVRRLD